MDNFIIELKEDFSAEKTISVNSKEESEEKQLAVNTLEDPNNEYRAIFAVDKLNEGWDVLNLFDIVRLYDARDAKNNIPGPTTIKEAQLIGRGARYCPFKLDNSDDPSKQKFDHDLQKYIDKIYDRLQEKYNDIYLVHNERFFKLYNFEDGKALEPDYVLFLRQKATPKSFHYQVFIEPKGSYLKGKDVWKEKFLVSLKEEQKIEQLWEDREYTVWGMPFYNKSEEFIFDKELTKLL